MIAGTPAPEFADRDSEDAWFLVHLVEGSVTGVGEEELLKAWDELHQVRTDFGLVLLLLQGSIKVRWDIERQELIWSPVKEKS